MFSSHENDFSKLSSLSSHFLNFLDSDSTVFSNVYKSGNFSKHLLTKITLLSNTHLELIQNIPLEVTHAISLDLDNI